MHIVCNLLLPPKQPSVVTVTFGTMDTSVNDHNLCFICYRRYEDCVTRVVFPCAHHVCLPCNSRLMETQSCFCPKCKTPRQYGQTMFDAIDLTTYEDVQSGIIPQTQHGGSEVEFVKVVIDLTTEEECD